MGSSLAELEGSDDADARLRALAEAGDTEAKAALGRKLVSSSDASKRDEGVTWTKKAAEDGSGAATHLLAAMAACGVGLRQDWRTAFDHLQRSAELGFELARAELALLANAPLTDGAALDPDLWKRLRAAIHLGFWRPAFAKAIFSSPRISIAEAFAPPAICDWLVERSRGRLKRAEITDPESGLGAYANARTNSFAGFKLGESDVVLHLLRARIAALTGAPVSAMEGATVMHYGVGEEFSRHHDFLDIRAPGHKEQVARIGQRVLTFLLYLNDDFADGETEFPELNWRYKGRKGDGLFFWNVDPKGAPDYATMHAGLSPASGEKWLLSQWVRGRV